MSRILFCAGLPAMLLGCLFSAVALGAPKITSVTVDEDKGRGEDRATVTIHGSNFGNKEHGAAVLHDFATHDYERGTLNDLHSNLADLEQIPSGQDVDESNARWAGTGGTNVFMALNREKRHEGSDGHYYGYRGGSRLSWPVAHGGRQNRDDWAGDRDMYYAFWMRTWHNVGYRWRIETTSKDFRAFNYTVKDVSDVAPGQNPQEGEAVTVGDQSGVLVGVEEGEDIDVVTLEIPGNFNANNLRGKTITGLDSGATAVFPSPDTDSSAIMPRISTSRVWQDPGRDGYNSYSWGRRGPSGVDSGTTSFDALWMSGGEWHLYEWEITLEEATNDTEIVARFNGKEVMRGAPSDSSIRVWDPALGGPTIAQLGPNIGGNLNYWEIDEIYLDNTRQRVVLADAETLPEASRYEIQTPVFWRDDEISVRLNYGALSADNALFLFVFDETGTPSEKGKLLCSNDCSARPEAPRTIELSQTANN